MDPSVTICLPSERVTKELGIDLERTYTLASLILRNSKVKHDPWTKGNLLGRLSKLIPQRACILITFVGKGRSGPFIHLEDRSGMPLLELIQYIKKPDFSPTFLFMITDDEAGGDLELFFDDLGDSQFIVWAPASHSLAVTAIGCEFSLWWGLRSLFKTEVDCEYVADKLAVLIRQFNSLIGSSAVRVRHSMRRHVTAWSGGEVFLDNVDFEKFTSGARSEQYADALKRLADAAFAPRAQHQSEVERLVSTQALFWFTELPPDRIDFDWLSATRLSFEVFGGSSAGWEPGIQPGRKDIVTIDRIREFLDAFVYVPAGTYAIGSESSEASSEPPADPGEVTLSAFRILKRPVIGDDWCLFAVSGQVLAEGNLPVTQCNAFQALMFAAIVEQVLQESGLFQGRVFVSLPTELQWEAAARGPQGFEYPWGNTFDESRCNCDLRLGARRTPPELFSPAGNSPFGCQDMAGNIREWTRSYGGVAGLDWRRHGQEESRDLASLQPSDRLIIRGGSYSYDPECVRTWVRNTQLASRRDSQTGFRLVIEGDDK